MLFRQRRAQAVVDHLLVATVAAVAVLVAAYVWMPDFQRGARAVVAQVAAWVGY